MNIFQKSVIVFGAAYYEYANWEPYEEDDFDLLSKRGFLNTYKGAFVAKCFVDACSFITLGMEPLLHRIVEWAPSLLTENQFSKLLFFIPKLYTSSQEIASLSFTSYTALTFAFWFIPVPIKLKDEQERLLKAIIGVIFHSFLIFDFAYLSLVVYLSPWIFCRLFYRV